MSRSSKAKRARRRRRQLEAIPGSPLDGWDRIGSPISRHRSGWIREIFDGHGNIERIEWRAGRDGDDAAVIIDRSNPQLGEIYDVLSCMRFAVEHEPAPKPEAAEFRRLCKDRLQHHRYTERMIKNGSWRPRRR